jgi:hypothetical protein
MEMNLDNARVRDGKKHAESPAAPRVQVEGGLLGTLVKHGVTLTPEFAKSLMELTATFQH